MSWYTTNLIAAILLPPFSLLLMFALGFWFQHRHHRLGMPLLLAAALLLWLASTPYVADGALHLLEARTAPLGRWESADAIVVLGGNTYFHAPEYAGQDTVSDQTLVRLRYGATLQRMTHKPLLVSGGTPRSNHLSEAQQMRVTLERDFQVPVRWTEDGSDNTFENARLSFDILQAAGIRRIYLVTHAWHMPRAAEAFRRAGFDVVEAPTAFTTRYRTDLLTFLPRADSLRDSRIFMHEVIGLAWYRLKLAILNFQTKEHS